MGLSVVADSVNPLRVTRDAWVAVAQKTLTIAVEIEVTCSDLPEHRRRLETRRSDIEGLTSPSWQAVHDRSYDEWVRPHVVIDTAGKSIEDAINELFRQPCFMSERPGDMPPDLGH
jgi:hypothetical protein